MKQQYVIRVTGPSCDALYLKLDSKGYRLVKTKKLALTFPTKKELRTFERVYLKTRPLIYKTLVETV